MSENVMNNGVVPRLSDYVLGIDLGTTNSSVAVYGPHGMDVISIPGEGLSMPSVVRFPDRKKDDLQVGQLAKKYIVSKPSEVFFSFKTQMASSEWALDPQMKEKYTIDGEELDPTQMAAQVLIKIREAVQAHPVYGQQGTICRAVICVPAQCQPTYIENVYKAAKLAGFGTWDEETGEKLYSDKDCKHVKGVTTLEEPTAAAIAYGLMDGLFAGVKNKSQKLLIYDFGGGTFDVTILEVISTTKKNMPDFRFINKGGDAKLGGDNIDWALVDLLAAKLSKSAGFNILEGNDSLKTKSVLKIWAEEAKISYAGGSAEYEFEKSMTINGQSFDFKEIVTKIDFLGIAMPIVLRTLDIVKDVLVENKLDIDDVNRIVLVGGSSKGPWVFDTIKEKLGKDPFVAPNVDTYVAAGASYYGSDIIGRGDQIIPTTLSKNYGIELFGGTFGPMLLKNEELVDGHISRTRHFTNVSDSGQLSLVGWTTSAMLDIKKDGETLTCERSILETDKDSNPVFTCIGQFDIEVPRKPAGTLDIELTMTINDDSSLQLTGKVDGTPISAEAIEWKY